MYKHLLCLHIIEKKHIFLTPFHVRYCCTVTIHCIILTEGWQGSQDVCLGINASVEAPVETPVNLCFPRFTQFDCLYKVSCGTFDLIIPCYIILFVENLLCKHLDQFFSPLFLAVRVMFQNNSATMKCHLHARTRSRLTSCKGIKTNVSRIQRTVN